MTERAPVLIVGGGPCGLVLAIELGRRGVGCVVFNDRPDTTPHPQANATQARTMEHFRRLGIAAEIRRQGLPGDYPTDIAYFTRYTGYELARFRQPASARTAEIARASTGSWSTPELPHRCSQLYIEQVLKRTAASYPSVTLRFGWTVTRVELVGRRRDRARRARRRRRAGIVARRLPRRRRRPAQPRAPRARDRLRRRERGGARLHGRADARYLSARAGALPGDSARASLDVLGVQPRAAGLHGRARRERAVRLPHPDPSRRGGLRRAARGRRGLLPPGARRGAPDRGAVLRDVERRLHAGRRAFRGRPAPSSAATPHTSSRRPAGSATTPRSRTR